MERCVCVGGGGICSLCLYLASTSLIVPGYRYKHCRGTVQTVAGTHVLPNWPQGFVAIEQVLAGEDCSVCKCMAHACFDCSPSAPSLPML